MTLSSHTDSLGSHWYTAVPHVCSLHESYRPLLCCSVSAVRACRPASTAAHWSGLHHSKVVKYPPHWWSYPVPCFVQALASSWSSSPLCDSTSTLQSSSLCQCPSHLCRQASWKTVDTQEVTVGWLKPLNRLTVCCQGHSCWACWLCCHSFRLHSCQTSPSCSSALVCCTCLALTMACCLASAIGSMMLWHCLIGCCCQAGH